MAGTEHIDFENAGIYEVIFNRRIKGGVGAAQLAAYFPQLACQHSKLFDTLALGTSWADWYHFRFFGIRYSIHKLSDLNLNKKILPCFLFVNDLAGGM